MLCTERGVFREKNGGFSAKEGLTFSVSMFDLFEDSHRAMGEDWTRHIIRGMGEKNRSHTRHRNTEEHENLGERVRAKDRKGEV